jgi:hypothetical protein
MTADGCWNQAAGGSSAQPDKCRSIVSGVGRISLGGCLYFSFGEGGSGLPQSIVQKGIRKDGLAAGGRGTRKELGVTVPDDRARLKDWGAGLDMDQHDHGGRDRDGRCRVHYDAQRAMVGIAVERMHVRYLDHGQQRQKGKTHHGDQRQSTWLWPAYPA